MRLIYQGGLLVGLLGSFIVVSFHCLPKGHNLPKGHKDHYMSAPPPNTFVLTPDRESAKVGDKITLSCTFYRAGEPPKEVEENVPFLNLPCWKKSNKNEFVRVYWKTDGYSRRWLQENEYEIPDASRIIVTLPDWLNRLEKGPKFGIGLKVRRFVSGKDCMKYPSRFFGRKNQITNGKLSSTGLIISLKK